MYSKRILKKSRLNKRYNKKKSKLLKKNKSKRLHNFSIQEGGMFSFGKAKAKAEAALAEGGLNKLAGEGGLNNLAGEAEDAMGKGEAKTSAFGRIFRRRKTK